MPSDILKDRLSALDDLAIKALKEVFDEMLERNKPDVILGDDNLLLGQKYRAYIEGTRIIEQAFIEINSYKVTKAPVKDFNKER